MTSNRPYLLRAIHQWIDDNGMTPYLVVDAAAPGVDVPPGVAKDGRVVLNIAHRAVAQLELGNDYVSFLARFSGVSRQVFVPVPAVLAIYAQETGEGMVLPPDAPADASEDVDTAPSSEPVASTPATLEVVSGPERPDDAPDGGGKRPRLRVVK